MVTVKCLYCDADNDPLATGGYCDACGKRLPPAAQFRSRRGPGGSLVGDQKDEEVAASPRSRSSEALFTIAALQLIAGGLFLVLAPVVATKLPDDFFPRLMLLAIPPVVLLGALGWAARFWPAGASIAAMAAYFVWTVLGFVFGVAMALVWLPGSLIVLALLLWPLIVSNSLARPARK
jgi:hypothetical protein